MKKIIEICFDPVGFQGGERGCYRARLKENRGIRDAGVTKQGAIEQLLLTLKSFGYSGSQNDYEIKER